MSPYPSIMFVIARERNALSFQVASTPDDISTLILRLVSFGSQWSVHDGDLLDWHDVACGDDSNTRLVDS